MCNSRTSSYTLSLVRKTDINYLKNRERIVQNALSFIINSFNCWIFWKTHSLWSKMLSGKDGAEEVLLGEFSSFALRPAANITSTGWEAKYDQYSCLIPAISAWIPARKLISCWMLNLQDNIFLVPKIYIFSSFDLFLSLTIKFFLKVNFYFHIWFQSYLTVRWLMDYIVVLDVIFKSFCFCIIITFK